MSALEAVFNGGVISGTSTGSGSPALGLDQTNNVLYTGGSGQSWASVGPSFRNVQGPQSALTTVTTAQTMFSVSIPANALNVVGKVLKIEGEAMFSNGATTPAITITALLGSTTIFSCATAANANTNVSSPLLFNIAAAVTTAGSSAKVECHGTVLECYTAAWASGTLIQAFTDGSTGASSAFDSTGALTLTVKIAADAALTSVTPRLCIAQIIN